MIDASWLVKIQPAVTIPGLPGEPVRVAWYPHPTLDLELLP